MHALIRLVSALRVLTMYKAYHSQTVRTHKQRGIIMKLVLLRLDMTLGAMLGMQPKCHKALRKQFT